MALTLDLDPEMEARVRDAAAAEGLDPSSFVLAAVRQRLPAEKSPADMSDSEILMRVGRGFPVEFWVRYNELKAKRDALTITQDELRELISFSDRVEEEDAERLRFLLELSRRQGTTVRELMAKLGLLKRVA
jgi:hypothetical protein